MKFSLNFNEIIPIFPECKFYMCWTFLIIVILIITSIRTPFIVAFSDDKNMHDFYGISEDLIFLIDMILNFITGYYD